MRTREEIERALEVINKALSLAIAQHRAGAEEIACVSMALEWVLKNAAGNHFQETIDMCNQLDASFKRAEASIEKARKAMEN